MKIASEDKRIGNEHKQRLSETTREPGWQLRAQLDSSLWVLIPGLKAHLGVQCTKDRMSPQAVLKSKVTKERRLADRRATVIYATNSPSAVILETESYRPKNAQPEKQDLERGVGQPGNSR